MAPRTVQFGDELVRDMHLRHSSRIQLRHDCSTTVVFIVCAFILFALSPRCIGSTSSSIRRWVSCRTCQPSCRRTCRSKTLPTTSMLPRGRQPHRSLRRCSRTRHCRTCRQLPTSRMALSRRSRRIKASKSVRRTTLLRRLHLRRLSTSRRSTMLLRRLHLRRWRVTRTKTMTRCRRRRHLLRWGLTRMTRHRRHLHRSLNKTRRRHRPRRMTRRRR